jgi:protein phosphatase
METHDDTPISGARPAGLVPVSAAGATRTGPRTVNADALLLDEAAGLFAVADGMGDGPRAVAVARMTLSAVRELFLGPWTQLPASRRSPDEAAARLSLGITQAQGRLYAPGRRGKERMGSTFAGVVDCHETLVVASVGDSRIYLLRRGARSIVQLTTDDTILGEAVARGQPPQEAAWLSRAHTLTRLVGGTREVQAVPVRFRWEPGDTAILCTDGVSDYVGGEDLAEIVQQAETAREAADTIVRRALATGGADNTSAIILRKSR